MRHLAEKKLPKYAQKNIFEKIIFPKIFLSKYFFRKKIQKKFVNIWELVLFYVLNTFDLNPLESPKPPRKSKKVIFRDLKIGAGVQKVALKFFLLLLVKIV